MGMTKLDPQPTLNPWTDPHQIWNVCTWLRRGYLLPKIGLNPPRWFCHLYTRNIHPNSSNVYCTFFLSSSERLQTRSLDRISLLIRHLTLWRPILPYEYSNKASCARPGSVIFCNFWHPGTLTLSPERQSARMSKIANEGLTRSNTRCLIAAVPYDSSGCQRVNVDLRKVVPFRGLTN